MYINSNKLVEWFRLEIHLLFSVGTTIVPQLNREFDKMHYIDDALDDHLTNEPIYLRNVSISFSQTVSRLKMLSKAY